MARTLTFDFETRSSVNIKRAGAYIYSIHPSTQVLCFSWSFDDGPVSNWHRGHSWCERSPFPQDVIDHVAAGGLVEAHNSQFELYIWNNALRREFPGVFPEMVQDQMECTAAKAAQFSLPRDLDGACRALRLRNQKDAEGKRLIQKLCKPRKPRKEELERMKGRDFSMEPLFNEEPEDLNRFWSYCDDDVRAERGLSKRLRAMTTREMAFWRMDQRMNMRGIQCDVPGVTTAIRMTSKEVERLNSEISELTGGAVPKGSSRQKLVKWVASRGYGKLLNTQGDHIDELLDENDPFEGDIEKALKDPMPEDVRRALEICKDANRTSTTKYKQMLLQAGDDGRLRDLMLYYGANRTGRWSGKGVQPHNFVRGFSVKERGDGSEFNEMEFAWDLIRMDDPEILELFYGSVMECLAKATRGGLTSTPDRDLMVADFAAIEARVLLWLADDQVGLGIFRRGEDIYLTMASDIYERQITKKDKPERQMGKKAILGLGYQMGGEKFDDECAAEGIFLPRAFFVKVVKTYREKSFPLVSSLWEETNAAAVEAVRNGGRHAVPCRLVKYKMLDGILHCRLPSSRLLSYQSPMIQEVHTLTWDCTNKQGKPATIRLKVSPQDSDTHAMKRAQKIAEVSEKVIRNLHNPKKDSKSSVTFMGLDQKTKQWVRMATYGGSLVENNTQATARDLLADAMLRCDDNPIYDMLLSVHDELIAECDENVGDVKEFEELMSVAPSWAEGCPIKAEGWRGKRYRK